MKRFVLKGRGITPEFSIPYAEELNEEQMAVVTAGGGPLLVIAGAGSGKTRTLTYRVARLVESGIPAESILLLTFTNKASRQMLHRVETLLGSPALRVTGGTFHHVGNVLIRKYATAVGLPARFTILDRGDARDLMKSVLAGLKVDVKKHRLPAADLLVSMHSLAVNTMRAVEELVLERYPQWADDAEWIQGVLTSYRRRKHELGVVDYDDLLLYWLALLEQHEEIGNAIRAQFSQILVDEYQDTNRLQGALLDNLARDHRNLTVVGDDAQSIYAFRGAHFENILTFPERYPDAQTFHLLTNYRSHPEILELANASIVNNVRQFKKELVALRPPGPQPLLARCRDVSQQAALVSEYVLQLLDEGRDTQEIAVLYRANFQSLEIQAEMTRRKIPFNVFGGIRFFEQAHVKDVIAHLRVLENPQDELAWLRVLPLIPRVGSKTAHRLIPGLEQFVQAAAPDLALEKQIAQSVPRGARTGTTDFLHLLKRLLKSREDGPGELIQMVVDGFYEEHLKEKHSNWRNRREDLVQLTTFASGYRNLTDFLAEIALLDNAQTETVVMGPDESRPLTLTTVHQAKGLEWPCVIVVGLSDGAFPSALALRDEDGEEEERRLFYVAVTRCKDELLLTFPSTRAVRGQGLMVQKPSRFLMELPNEVFEEMAVAEEVPTLPSATPYLPDADDFVDPDIPDEDYFHD